MTTKRRLVSYSIVAAALAAMSMAIAEPTPFPAPVQMYGGNGMGRSGNPALSDPEILILTKAEMANAASMGPKVAAVTAARTELTRVTFVMPTNVNEINAKANALAQAELAVAMARADIYPAIKGQFTNLSDAKLTAIKARLGGQAAGRGGRGN